MSRSITYSINLDSEHFPHPLQVQFVDGFQWQLLSDFSYIRDNGEVIKAETGFLTDFGSKPKWTWLMVGSPTDEGGPAYIPHDWMCQHAQWPFAKTDKIFLEALRDCGVSYIKRIAMYLAVRAFHFFN